MRILLVTLSLIIQVPAVFQTPVAFAGFEPAESDALIDPAAEVSLPSDPIPEHSTQVEVEADVITQFEINNECEKNPETKKGDRFHFQNFLKLINGAKSAAKKAASFCIDALELKRKDSIDRMLEESGIRSVIDELLFEKKLEVKPIGINGGRPIILVSLEGASYRSRIGEYKEWIPFYLSTGINSGENNKGKWFPFHGICIRMRAKLPFGKEEATTWWIKVDRKARYRFKFKMNWKERAKYWRESLEILGEKGNDRQWRSRNEYEPVLAVLSKRLFEEAKWDQENRNLIFENQEYPLPALSISDVNHAIGSNNGFGIELTQLPKSRFGKEVRERYLEKNRTRNENSKNANGAVTSAPQPDLEAKRQKLESIPSLDEIYTAVDYLKFKAKSQSKEKSKADKGFRLLFEVLGL